MVELIEYHHPVFKGKLIICHKDFSTYLDKMADHASGLGIEIIVTSSYRESIKVNGAIVKPSTRSNHMIGHAIDCNLKIGNKVWNSESLKTPDTTIRSFIQLCKADGIRWGGDFKTPDTVHFDVPINIESVVKWNNYFNQIHNEKHN
jgi:hypothetical protein